MGENMAGMPFATSKIFVIMGESNPLAKNTSLKLKDLKNEVWLAIDGGESSTYRNFIVRMCQSLCGFVPKRIRMVRSREVVLNFIAMGEGICLLSDFMLPQDREGIKVLPIDYMKPMTLQAVYSTHNKEPLLKEFLNMLKGMKG